MKNTFTLLFTLLFFALIAQAAAITGGTRLYFTPNANWKEADARFAAYYFGDGEAWASMTAVAGETDLYVAVSPEGKNFTHVIFTRMNPGEIENNWSNKWSQTADLVFDGVNNHYVITEGKWDGDNGTWVFFEEPKDPFVSLSIPVSVFVDEDITFSALVENITDPMKDFYVKTPSSEEFVTVSSPYTHEGLGVYSFKVEVKEGAEGEVVAIDTKDVWVKAIPADFIISVKNTADWAQMYLFVWGTQDDGFKAMNLVEVEDEAEWYSYTFTRVESANFLFVNADDWEAAEQSHDVDNVAASTCYELGEIDEGKRLVNAIACPDFNTGLTQLPVQSDYWVDKGRLHINFENDSKLVELYSISGQVILPQTYLNHFDRGLSEGVYILRIDGVARKLLVL